MSTTVEDLTIDNKNRIWVAGNNGLLIIKEENGLFYSVDLSDILNTTFDIDKLIAPTALFYDDSDKMWIGTSKGLFVADLENRSLHQPGELALIDDFIDDIAVDKNHNIWISRKSKTSRFIYFPGQDIQKQSQVLAANIIETILERRPNS